MFIELEGKEVVSKVAFRTLTLSLPFPLNNKGKGEIPLKARILAIALKFNGKLGWVMTNLEKDIFTYKTALLVHKLEET